MAISIYKTFTREKLTYQDANALQAYFRDYINTNMQLISDCVSTNTANKVVKRDASGNFAAGTITAALTGNVTGDLTGTASKATNIVGGGAGQIAYQSAADTTAMLAAGTSGYLLQSGGTGAPSWIEAATAGSGDTIAKRSANGNVTGNRLISSVATGTAPLGITSTTIVTNLNVDQVDGFDIVSVASGTTAPMETGGVIGISLGTGGSGHANYIISCTCPDFPVVVGASSPSAAYPNAYIRRSRSTTPSDDFLQIVNNTGYTQSFTYRVLKIG